MKLSSEWITGLVLAVVAALVCSELSAADIVEASGVEGGLVVHVGCGEGKLIAEMLAGDDFLIQGLDTDPGNVEKARALIRSRGLCGQVSASVFDGKHLPYIDNMVNLLVTEAVDDISMEEIMRVLTPRGVAYVRGDGGWKKSVKPVPEGIDDWGQFLYDPGGNPVGGDRRVGPPRHIQWESGPRWSRSHENMSSVSAVVSAGGRLFTIMDEGPPGSIYHSAKWSLTARDAFNGVVIWKKPLTRWQSSVYPLKRGPFQLPRRLIAVGDKVYVTLGIDTPVSELSAITGEVLRTFDGTEATEEIIHDRGKLILTVANEKSRLALAGIKMNPPSAGIKKTPPSIAAREFTVRVSGDRSVMAIDLESGKTLWKQQAGNVTPVTLATAADRVFYHADEHVHCLSLADGKPAWQTELGRKSRYIANNGPSLLVEDDVLVFGEQMRITGVSIRDGNVLWTAEGKVSRCIAPVSLCVIDGVVWAPRSMAWDTNAGFKPEGPSGSLIGYDLHTGKKAGEWQFDESLDIGVMHHRCHMPKATDKFVLTGWPGIEFIDTRTGKMFTHNWVRGACLSGALPANGLVYAPPNPCACYPEGRLTGFNALAPARESRVKSQESRAEDRLERGPGYPPPASSLQSPASSDWPTYRGDAMRTGSVNTSLPSTLEKCWQTDVGGKLTQPVVADGRLFVASIDTHTVHGYDADSGRKIWSFQAGGRVDSAPTWHNGRALFGSHDGYVYSVNAATGQLAWKYLAARDERQIVSYDQLESLWPVPGNILVVGDTAYFIAGKNSYLDGGLWLYRLNAQTGEMLSETNVCFLNAEGRHPRQRGPGLLRIEMTGALPDILSSDGQYIYMRHFVFNLEGNIADTAGNNHLIVGNGFRDDSWFHRSFWTYGVGPINARSGFSQGQGNGAQMMVMDGGHLFYYGRALGRPQNQLFGEKHFLSSCPKPKLPPSEAFRKSRHNSRGQDKAPDDRIWSHETGMHARGMIVGKDTLFVAGPQGDWLSSAAVYDGKEGVVLAAISTDDGKTLSEHKLPVSPVYDGMSAAGGRLYISSTDGSVTCFAGCE